jgi:hypothetical protein
MKKALAGLVFLLCFQLAQAQNMRLEKEDDRGVLYFGLGTNLSFYTRSDISFERSDANFVLQNVKAKDDRGLKFGDGAPQYTYQVGYYFKKKGFGLEFNFDHVKYFARHDQDVHVKGTINGKFVDADTAITSIVQNFEHSDGANYALFNVVKWKNLYTQKDKKSFLDLVLKAGAGPLVPKTNSTVLGAHYDDEYKFSGYVIGLEGGLRYNFLKSFYIAPTIKGAYANYTNFVIAGGSGSQHWFGAHVVLVVGAQFSL